MFFITRDNVKLSAFKVTAADFNGKDFDGAPFEGDAENHKWLYLKMKSGVITLLNSRATDYAVWTVPNQDGEKVLASPGDYIVYNEASDDVFVCDGRLWALLMLGVEPIAMPEVEVVLDPSVETMDKGELAKLLEVRPGTPEELGIRDPVEGRTYGMVIYETISGFSHEDEVKLNSWCDRVYLAMGNLDHSVKRDWPGFLKEVEDILGERAPETLPLAWLKTYGIVGAMAKSFDLIEAGHEEFHSLQTARCIGQTLVNRVTGKEAE